MIIFSEKEHKYIHLESGNVLKGWTSLIKNYTEPFDMENQAICSAYSNYLGKTYRGIKFGRMAGASTADLAAYFLREYPDMPPHFIDEIKYEWNYAAILGSELHLKAENRSYERGYEINPFDDKKYKTIKLPKQYDNQSLADCLYDLEDGYYPELLVWDFTMPQEHTPVTMIDGPFIETVGKIRYIDTNDWKTNGSIWAGKDRKMKGPLSSLYDNTEEKYKLQACFGAKLMATHGFVPRDCGFTHVKEYDLNKTKLYYTKYNHELMDNFQADWKRIYDDLEIVTETD